MADTVEQIFTGLQNIVEHIERSARTQGQAETILHGAAVLVTQLTHSPAWVTASKIAEDLLAHQIEDDLFSPCKLATPAHDLLDSCEQLAKLGEQLQAWSRDPRFRWRLPLPWTLKLEQRVPPEEIRREMGGAAKAIMLEMRRSQVIFQEIAGLRDVRQEVVPVAPLSVTVSSGAPGYLVPMPSTPYTSDAQKVKDLRFRIWLLGIRLATDARKSCELINQGSIGTQAYQPANVIMQASILGDLAASALLTCLQLAALAI